MNTNNHVQLHGYVTKLFLNQKVGSISLKVEDEYKGVKKETPLNVTCFGTALTTARDLKDYQYVTVQGRLSRRNKDDVWTTEVIADKVTPTNTYNKMKTQMDEAFKENW